MYCTVVTMVKIQFLTILLVVTRFLGGVVSVTDNEFEVRHVQNRIICLEVTNIARKLSVNFPRA